MKTNIRLRLESEDLRWYTRHDEYEINNDGELYVVDQDVENEIGSFDINQSEALILAAQSLGVDEDSVFLEPFQLKISTTKIKITEIEFGEPLFIPEE